MRRLTAQVAFGLAGFKHGFHIGAHRGRARAAVAGGIARRSDQGQNALQDAGGQNQFGGVCMSVWMEFMR